jgi:hypothetical protein
MHAQGMVTQEVAAKVHLRGCPLNPSRARTIENNEKINKNYNGLIDGDRN